jgi:LacI family transcriptional regulator
VTVPKVIVGEHRRNRSAKVVTLREVAERAGVDVSTASRALTGRRKVTPGVARRVRSAALALGYSPNAAARTLRLARTMTLGLVLSRLSEPLFDFEDGLGSGVESQGYSLMLTVARGDPERYRTLVRRLFERRVDGLFVASPPDLADALAPYEKAGVPVMELFDRGAGPDTLPLLTATEEDAVGRAVVRLAELGHRCLLYLATPLTIASIRATWLAQAAERAGVRLSRDTVARGEPDPPFLERMRAHLSGAEPVTAIFTELMTLARLLRVLGALAARVPADVSLVAFGESAWTAELGFPMASIRHDMLRLGRMAAATMLGWLQGTRPPTVITAGVGEWVERASVGPAPAVGDRR